MTFWKSRPVLQLAAPTSAALGVGALALLTELNGLGMGPSQAPLELAMLCLCVGAVSFGFASVWTSPLRARWLGLVGVLLGGSVAYVRLFS